jgi:DNA-binding CsgD family transcriptional regulator
VIGQEAVRRDRRQAVGIVERSDRERLLVALLAQGHTDASAARTLRISERSVTYAVRALMDRLGVDSRFQLGLALGAMGVAPRRRSQAFSLVRPRNTALPGAEHEERSGRADLSQQTRSREEVIAMTKTAIELVEETSEYDVMLLQTEAY